MHDLTVVVGFLVLVGLLVSRIQHESVSREQADNKGAFNHPVRNDIRPRAR